MKVANVTHRLEIKSVSPVTHDVRRFTLERPQDYDFTPGQATDVAIDKDGWREEQRPFTFTSLPDASDLEFTIKGYPSHDGVTEQLHELAAGDHLLIEDPWGTIEYKGKGTFIAGGAGVTPFIAILRQLHADDGLDGNRLIFSNRQARDIILKDEFDRMRGLDVTYVLTDGSGADAHEGRIDRAFLEQRTDDFDQHFYVCGPDQMVEDINEALKSLGADPDGLVFEE